MDDARISEVMDVLDSEEHRSVDVEELIYAAVAAVRHDATAARNQTDPEYKAAVLFLRRVVVARFGSPQLMMREAAHQLDQLEQCAPVAPSDRSQMDQLDDILGGGASQAQPPAPPRRRFGGKQKPGGHQSGGPTSTGHQRANRR